MLGIRNGNRSATTSLRQQLAIFRFISPSHRLIRMTENREELFLQVWKILPETVRDNNLNILKGSPNIPTDMRNLHRLRAAYCLGSVPEKEQYQRFDYWIANRD